MRGPTFSKNLQLVIRRTYLVPDEALATMDGQDRPESISWPGFLVPVSPSPGRLGLRIYRPLFTLNVLLGLFFLHAFCIFTIVVHVRRIGLATIDGAVSHIPVLTLLGITRMSRASIWTILRVILIILGAGIIGTTGAVIIVVRNFLVACPGRWRSRSAYGAASEVVRVSCGTHGNSR
jgi:hypothetical protein